MKVEIKFPRFEYRHRGDVSAMVAFAQLFNAETDELIVHDRALAELLMLCHEADYEVVNAQELLIYLVVTNGFAA